MGWWLASSESPDVELSRAWPRVLDAPVTPLARFTFGQVQAVGGSEVSEGSLDRNGPCESRWLDYFVDREVGAIW